MRRTFDDKDVDGVIVATPEHWHALATVWACQAGKDVYVEKNISLSIWEGRKMVEAARKYQRIVQCGTQNRSAPYALSAREYLASGKLGKIVHVKVYNLLQGGRWKPQPDTPFLQASTGIAFSGPRGRFLLTLAGSEAGQTSGTTREGPFPETRAISWTLRVLRSVTRRIRSRCIVWADDTHRRQMRDAGFPGHHVGLWRLRHDVRGGTFTPYMKKFPNEVRYGKTWPHWALTATKVEIYGSQQVMYLGQHGAGWQVFEADGKVVAEEKDYFPDKWHQPNFVNCIRDRKRPNGDIEQGHSSATLVHLANVAHRSGNRLLQFNGQSETFVGDEQPTGS